MLRSVLTVPLVFAHQYGWDEIAMFLVPIALAIAGVRFAEKRAAERKRREATEATDDVAPDAEHQSP